MAVEIWATEGSIEEREREREAAKFEGSSKG